MFECVKQAFSALGNMSAEPLVKALKCNSNCCTNIKVYDPKGCCFNGEISNRWRRENTPSAESPTTRSRTQQFFTPRNK
jgi:hypothetical protein